MRPELLHILQHSIGADEYGEGGGYRNHFVTDPECADGKRCQELVALGLMKDHGPQTLAGGMHCYCVTDAGKAAIPAYSKVKPKLTRSQARYRRYLEIGDMFENFRQFLAYDSRRPTP